MLTRRALIVGASRVAAPAVVRCASLMKMRGIVVPVQGVIGPVRYWISEQPRER